MTRNVLNRFIMGRAASGSIASLLLATVMQLVAADQAVAQNSGQTLFRQRCSVCHNDPATRATMPRTGPDLAGVVGRAKGSAPGFTRYSAGMKKMKGAWTAAELDKFLAAPAKAVPGTVMIFPGLPNAQDRAAVIGYLQSASAKK